MCHSERKRRIWDLSLSFKMTLTLIPCTFDSQPILKIKTVFKNFSGIPTVSGTQAEHRK